MKNSKRKTLKKLIVFGTLFDSKIGAFKDILVFLGKEKEVKKIDKEYQKRKFFAPWGLEQLAKLYKGFTKNKLEEIALDYCQQNLMQGAREIVAELKKRNFLIGAISSNPQFVMNALYKIIPLDFSEGTKLEFKEGIATGKIERKINRYIKADILKEKRKKYGIKKEQVIIIGNSITCYPMIKEAKIFIDFNPRKEKIKDIASMIEIHTELRKAFL